jgi:drug/metabolite transporter (DMT)-like permease
MNGQTEGQPAISPYLGMAVGIAVVSTAALVIRYAQREAPSLSIAAWRLTTASLVLAPVALTRHRAELARLTRAELARAAASGFFLALHFATWISSLEYTSVAASSVLVATNPLFVGLLSPLILKERVGRIMLVGILIAFAGSSIIALGDVGSGSDPLWGDLLAVLGAATVAGYMMIGRTLRRQLSLLTYIFIVYGVGAVVLLVIVAVAWQPLWGFPAPTYGLLIYLGLGPQLIGHSSFNWALRYLSAAYVTVTLLSEPVGASILAWVRLGEPPKTLEVVGGALIMAGITVASRTERT